MEQQDRAIDRLMSDTNDYLKELVVKASRGDSVSQSALENKLPLLFTFWSTSLANILVKYNQKAVDLARGQAISVTEVFNDSTISKKIDAVTTKFKDSIERTLFSRRLFDDNKSLGSRIKTIERQYLGSVKDVIRVGIKDGRSARQIASDIDNILLRKDYKVWTSPLDWFRQATGRDVTTARRGGSLDVSTYRIARTEINETYRLATVKAHQNQPWVRGFRWSLSPAHAVECICEDYDGQVFKDESELPHTHPHCMCIVTPELVDPEEIQ